MDIAEQRKKAETFRALHHGPDILLLANTSDAATSRVVVEVGYPAVATSSASVAWAQGYPDGEIIPPEEMVAVVARIAQSVDVPVTADMEAGYGANPKAVAKTIRLTLGAGAVGLNLEDSDPHAGGHPLYDFDSSVERILAGRAAADEFGVPIVINARVDAFAGKALGSDEWNAALDEAARRGNAYLEAGADCAFVPFVRDAETIAALVRDIDGPVNTLSGAPSPTVPELRKIGVRRVSVGGLLSLAAATLFRNAAEEIRGPGTYSFAKGVILHPEMNKLMS
ncbi:MAG: isocitrate lyase/phosphoenolpyruvate mutase family protein [Pseudomonadota bacterium]|nr:isocitrate lyase/phosphoenolpyruvate mutase family protein [Pseudomonadota bacterium]